MKITLHNMFEFERAFGDKINYDMAKEAKEFASIHYTVFYISLIVFMLSLPFSVGLGVNLIVTGLNIGEFSGATCVSLMCLTAMIIEHYKIKYYDTMFLAYKYRDSLDEKYYKLLEG